MIAIIDYGVNNLASVRNAFRAAGAEVTVTADHAEIKAADGIVLPGIGAATAGMRQLQARGLDGVVHDVGGAGTPVLGICLGMQLLFERSEEGDAECLGLLPGSVALLQGEIKVPHIGWNQVERRASPLWAGLEATDPYFYFVHSYICVPADTGVIAGSTEYGGMFCSAVARGSVWGVQFHPERSGATGRQVLCNFVAACSGAES